MLIHGQQLQGEHLEEAADYCVSAGTWQHRDWFAAECWGFRNSEGRISAVKKRSWMPKPNAIESLQDAGPSISEVPDFGEGEWEPMPDGWTHDHCTICWWTIAASDDPDVSTAWYCQESDEWVCNECYEKLLNPRLEAKKNA